jgi:DNA invertase Pin-like site-specific DNA recombinase
MYRDRGLSGAKGRDKRPAFDRLCRDARRRQFDTVRAWSVDRLGRSLQDVVGFLSGIHALGIDLYLHREGLDSATARGKALFEMMGIFSDYADTAVMRSPTSDAEQAVAQSIDAA